jgi:Na+/H+-dicarboxylate symporter
VLGALFRQTPAFGSIVMSVLEPLGTLWTNAMQLTVLPLLLASLAVAVFNAQSTKGVGRLGGVTLLFFVALLSLAAAFAMAVTPPLLAWLAPAPGTLPALPQTRALEVSSPAPGPAAGLAEWLVGLVPTNPIRAALDGNLPGLIIFTVLIALALNSTTSPMRETAIQLIKLTAETMRVIVNWILRLTPIAVFILAVSLAFRTGGRASDFLFSFIVICSSVVLAFTMLLYPIATLGGRAGLGRFARAVFPAQMVALTTRSSLAAQPALLEGAERARLLHPTIAGVVLPMTSTIKISRMLGGVIEVLCLAHAYGIALTTEALLTFIVTMMLLSFVGMGMPQGGAAGNSLPAFAAVGIPIEGVILLDAVDPIPDAFRTAVNVTGQMAGATVLGRLFGMTANVTQVADPASGPIPVAAEAVRVERFPA